MTEANIMAGGENLAQKTEAYFRRVIAVNREYASIVLRSCVSTLPECETTSSVLSRCIEALSLVDDGNGVMRCLNGVEELRPVDFQLIVQSMNRWLSGSHDQLYRVVDLYLKEYKGKTSDEEKIAMCNYIGQNTKSNLTHELSGMRKLLKESDQNTKSNLTHDSARSASFRLSS